MTRALYHENGTLLNFTATVQDVQGAEIALDATAFYPEGGGQNGDSGLLRWPGGEARVLGTRKDKASGIIWHTLEGDVPPRGRAVAGEIDATRRWRHMQRHSGEHLLAQAFKRVHPAFGVVSVNMGSPECTIDLVGDPTETDVRAAETLLRETLGRDELILETPFVSEAELSQYPLRRETKVQGRVRLVIFRDRQGECFDVSACGGTHVPRASMCAPVVVLRTERVKGGQTRVVFMAGEEAGAYLSGVYRQSRMIAQGFSVPVERLPERMAVLQGERDTLKTELASLRLKLAAGLVGQAQPQGMAGIPVRGVELDDIQLLLPVLSSVPAGELLLAVTPDGRCGIASAHPKAHAGDLLRKALAITGGKGGGKPDLAQGQTMQPQQFQETVQHVLTQD